MIVVVYRMSDQAMNTLYTLSAAYQRNVREKDYEVIVVENHSDDLLDEANVYRMGKNFRYILREEASPSPVAALNEGFEISKGGIVCLMIDGARMVTPRVMEYALCASHLFSRPLVAVPGYHLGYMEQQFSRTSGYDEKEEKRLLSTVKWRENGYELFSVSCLSGANRNGFMAPMMECNCLFCSRESFKKIGKADLRFDMPGGGMINLDLFKRLMLLTDIRFVVLPGEGSFHQFHKGVTTMEQDNKEELYASFNTQYRSIRGEPFSANFTPREPFFIGAIAGPAQTFVVTSAQRACRRYQRLMKLGHPEWKSDNE